MCGEGLPSTTHLSHSHKLLALLQLKFNSALFDTRKANPALLLPCAYPKPKADNTHISQHSPAEPGLVLSIRLKIGFQKENTIKEIVSRHH